MHVSTLSRLDDVYTKVKKKLQNRHFHRRIEQEDTPASIALDTLPDWARGLMYTNNTAKASNVVVAYASGSETHVASANRGFQIPLKKNEAPTSITITPQDVGEHIVVMY